MPNPTGKGGFVDHPEHRNMKGRPRNLDELRELALQIANEYLELPDTETGKKRRIRRVRIALTRLLNSGNPAALKIFFEYAFGKVPQPVELSGVKSGEPITLNVVYAKSKEDDREPGV